MSGAAIMALVLLPLTVLHLLLTVALIRRTAEIGATRQLAGMGPAVTTTLGAVPGQGLDGQHHGDVPLDGALIAVLSGECPECAEAASALADAVESGTAGPRVIAFVLVPDGAAPSYATRLAELTEMYLLRDPAHPLLATNDIRVFPYYLRTDDQAVIRAAGQHLPDVLPPTAARPSA